MAAESRVKWIPIRVSERGHSLSEIISELHSERISLKPISKEYLEEIFENFTDDIARYMAHVPTGNIEDTISFIENSARSLQEGTEAVFVITLRESGEFLGCCGIHGQNEPSSPSLGLWLKKHVHGMGYGREVIRLIREWAEFNLEYSYLRYEAHPANEASKKIPERLGGVKTEGLRKCLRSNGESFDAIEYRFYPVPD